MVPRDLLLERDNPARDLGTLVFQGGNCKAVHAGAYGTEGASNLVADAP